MRRSHAAFGVLAAGLFLWIGSAVTGKNPPVRLGDPVDLNDRQPLTWMVPDESIRTPRHEQTPFQFVTRGANAAEWDALTSYFTEAESQSYDSAAGMAVKHKVIKVKVPLGLNQAPVLPVENPITLAKWRLGKKLYYDPILSGDATVSCATCHDPGKGFTDQRKTSTGIGGFVGGANAPTVINSAFFTRQFWDGRAASLEAQAQGPVANPAEMSAGGDDGHAWDAAVRRIRKSKEYVKAFREVFGHPPTRDAVAKAIAAYERTVLSGNSISDRAEVEMKARVTEGGGFQFEVKPADYEAVVKAAFDSKDSVALRALNLDPAKDRGRAADVAKSIHRGLLLFKGKAQCTNCHVGENFSDNTFHNLGVGAVNGLLPKDGIGRFGALPTGHKDPQYIGAYKTPGLRALLNTFPYMHDGSEKTLEEVVEFYNQGGNANEFLDPKMRDLEAELAYRKAKAAGKPYNGPEVFLCGPRRVPIVPKKLNLTAQEKIDLILYMRSLQGDPIAKIVTDE